MSSAAPRTLADQLRSWARTSSSPRCWRRGPTSPRRHPTTPRSWRPGSWCKASVLRALDALDALRAGRAPGARPGTDPADLPAGRGRRRAGPWSGSVPGPGLGQPTRPVLVVGELLRLPAGPGVEEAHRAARRPRAQARAILDHLHETGGRRPLERRRRPDRRPGRVPGSSPAIDERHVTVPWTVRLALRSDTRPSCWTSRHALAISEREQAMVDRAAAGAAFELVRRTELLLDRWGTHPPPALKAGGLGVRDLRAAAALLHVETGGRGPRGRDGGTPPACSPRG